jgi:hypothetical protein
MRTGNIGRSRVPEPEPEKGSSEQEPAQSQLVLLPQKSPEPAPGPVSQEPMFEGDVLQAPSLAPKAEVAPPVASTDPAPPPDLHGLHCAAVLDTIRGTIRGLTDQVAAIPANQLLEVRGELDEAVKAALELRAVITRAIESPAVGEEEPAA